MIEFAMRTPLVTLSLLLPLGLLACSDLTEEGVVNDEDPLTSTNGISSNGISSNGISSNGISSNALSTNALSTNSLSTNGTLLTTLRDKTSTGDLSRMFFRYVVNCALPAGQSVTYSWTDSAGVVHTEINPGGLGLAPGWATAPADTNSKELVSACLGARTNSLGVTVPLSLRAKGVSALAVGSQERTDYTYGEGAFWGNLFNGGSPYLYSCSRSPFKFGATGSQYTTQGRTCTTGGCGIITAVGPCFTSDIASTGQACWERAANDDWVNKCSSANYRYASSNQAANIISTWLKP
jgi:hypothetical protein